MTRLKYLQDWCDSWVFGWAWEAWELCAMGGNELARQYMDTAWKIKCGLPADPTDVSLLAQHCAFIDPRGEPPSFKGDNE